LPGIAIDGPYAIEPEDINERIASLLPLAAIA